ncbi:hypothetical protein TNCV_658851 [Trichonephila clavipes]|nr:hypothetical protein TNCV_658851 [Trichonephila clavipes]
MPPPTTESNKGGSVPVIWPIPEYIQNIMLQHQGEDPTGLWSGREMKKRRNGLARRGSKIERRITRIPRDCDTRTHLKKGKNCNVRKQCLPLHYSGEIWRNVSERTYYSRASGDGSCNFESWSRMTRTASELACPLLTFTPKGGRLSLGIFNVYLPLPVHGGSSAVLARAHGTPATSPLPRPLGYHGLLAIRGRYNLV